MGPTPAARTPWLRWHILKTLLRKEVLRHLANRGGILLVVLLLVLALALLPLFTRSLTPDQLLRLFPSAPQPVATAAPTAPMTHLGDAWAFEGLALAELPDQSTMPAQESADQLQAASTTSASTATPTSAPTSTALPTITAAPTNATAMPTATDAPDGGDHKACASGLARSGCSW